MSQTGGSSSSHSVAFRVMRLCRPSFNVDPPLRIDPDDLFVGEDHFDDPSAPSAADLIAPDSDPSYRDRFLLHHFSDSMGLSGLLVLPQSFGFPTLSQFSITYFFILFYDCYLDSNLLDAEQFTWERLSVAI